MIGAKNFERSHNGLLAYETILHRQALQCSQPDPASPGPPLFRKAGQAV